MEVFQTKVNGLIKRIRAVVKEIKVGTIIRIINTIGLGIEIEVEVQMVTEWGKMYTKISKDAYTFFLVDMMLNQVTQGWGFVLQSVEGCRENRKNS